MFNKFRGRLLVSCVVAISTAWITLFVINHPGRDRPFEPPRERGFAKYIGLSQNSIEAVFGRPEDMSGSINRQVWYYARSGLFIEFDDEGRVAEIGRWHTDE